MFQQMENSAFTCVTLCIASILSLSLEVFALSSCPPGKFCPIGANCTNNTNFCVIVCPILSDRMQQGNHLTGSCERIPLGAIYWMDSTKYEVFISSDQALNRPIKDISFISIDQFQTNDYTYQDLVSDITFTLYGSCPHFYFTNMLKQQVSFENYYDLYVPNDIETVSLALAEPVPSHDYEMQVIVTNSGNVLEERDIIIHVRDVPPCTTSPQRLVDFSSSNFFVSKSAGSLAVTLRSIGKIPSQSFIVGIIAEADNSSKYPAVAGIDFTPGRYNATFATGATTANASIPIIFGGNDEDTKRFFLKLYIDGVVYQQCIFRGNISIATVFVMAGNDNVNDTIQIRLINGPDAHEGRVEILYAGVWGAICNDLFNLTAANVVCRQLGYPGALRLGSYESDSAQIWLDDVQCTGNETSIDQCSHNGFNIYDCNLRSDQVGVKCIDNDTNPLQLCLVGGSNERQGRIEILYYGIWGYVCDVYFSLNSANVACRRLGFPGALRVWTNYPYSSTAPLWLSHVRCIGNEIGLEQCSHLGFGDYGTFCDQYDDVGVVCIGNDNLNDTIQVRLINGQDAHEGRVEILYAGVWGAICNDLFNLTAANVVCRQLGYPGALRVGSYRSSTGQIWLDDVQCTGNETSIDQCSHNGFNIYDCNFNADQVGVKCIDNGTAPLPIRLIGSSVLQGRIEILYYGIWGTICDTNFDLDSANVACRRLGFPGAARVLRYIAGGTNQIWLDDVQCNGDEISIEMCTHNGFGVHNCRHRNDVGVVCIDVTVVRFSQSTYRVNEDVGSVQAVLILNHPVLTNVTVRVSTNNKSATGGGVDYVSGPFSVTIPAGQTNISFDVPIIDDNIHEQNENFRLTIVRSSTPDDVQVGRPRRATVVIRDDSDCTPCNITGNIVVIEVGVIATFSSGNPETTFICKLDSNRPESCTSPMTYTSLNRGRHRIVVIADCPCRSSERFMFRIR